MRSPSRSFPLPQIRSVAVAMLTLTLSFAIAQAQTFNVGKLRKEAEAGDARAQFLLSGLFVLGRGVEKDPKEAFRLIELSAKQGHVKACSSIGPLLMDGIGCKKDEKKAVEWYRKGVEAGDPPAMLQLSRAYQRGRGVDKDKEKVFTSIPDKLTGEQIAEAEQLAAEFKPRRPKPWVQPRSLKK